MEIETQRYRKQKLSELVADRHDPNGRGGTARLANDLDRSPGYISQMLKFDGDGSRPITEKTAREIEGRLGLERGWFDDHPPIHGRTANQITSSKDAIVIPLLDVAAAMGSGIDRPAGHVDVIEQMVVSKDWLRKNISATSPGNLAIITAYGDSMEGTFNDGDLLLVDRGITDIKLDAVYVLALNDELFIKRLQRRPDGVMLMLSDNQKYAPYEIKNGDMAHFEVLGRVLLTWNARRL